MKRYFLLGLAFLFLLTSFLTAHAAGKKIKYGFIDKTGKVVIEPQFDGTEEQFTGLAHFFNLGEPVFREGLAPVMIRGQWGYIDRTGAFVIKPQFFVVRPFSEGFAAVQPHRQHGWDYIDKTGKLLIVSSQVFVAEHAAHTAITEAHSFSEGFAWIKVEGIYVLINNEPKVILGFDFRNDDARDFREGMAAVGAGGTWAYIGRAGEVMFLPSKVKIGAFEVPDQKGCFSEGMAVLKMDGKYGFIDKKYDSSKNDKCVIEPQFEDAFNFREGLASVKINGKRGYIDKTGKFAIKPQFDIALPFSEGLAAVKIGNQWGYINKTGKFVVGPKFEFVSSFSDGMGRIVVGGKTGFVDKTGKIVIEPKFDYAQNFSEGLAAVQVPEGLTAVQAKQTSPEQLAGTQKIVEPGQAKEAASGSSAAPGKESYEDYIDQGITYSIAGHDDQAIAAFTKAIELYPKRAEAYYQRGLIYGGLKRQYDQAILDFTKAIELNPKSAETYSFRATAYSGKGKYDQAVADINKAVALDPKNAKVYFNKAVVYEDMKRNKETIEAYRMVIKYATSQDKLLIEHAKKRLTELEKRR